MNVGSGPAAHTRPGTLGKQRLEKPFDVFGEIEGVAAGMRVLVVLFYCFILSLVSRLWLSACARTARVQLSDGLRFHLRDSVEPQFRVVEFLPGDFLPID